MTTNVPAPEMSSSSGAGHRQSLVERAQAALNSVALTGNDIIGSAPVIRELIAEVRTLTQKLAQAEAERDSWRARASGGRPA